MKDLTYETFADDLCVKIPGFHLVYEEHIDDYDEVLPHVLLGDLVRFLTAEVELHGDASAAVKAAMLLLERAMGSQDLRIQELVAVSFLENLDPEHSSFSVLSALFGPRLEEQYQRTRLTLDVTGRDLQSPTTSRAGGFGVQLLSSGFQR